MRRIRASCSCLFLDGSGTRIFNPASSFARHLTYCSWHAQQELRWFVAVAADGRILHVSVVYEGRLDDTKAMTRDDFFALWNSLIAPYNKLNPRRPILMGGDKAYAREASEEGEVRGSRRRGRLRRLFGCGRQSRQFGPWRVDCGDSVRYIPATVVPLAK